jgi:hypothetical protein
MSKQRWFYRSLPANFSLLQAIKQGNGDFSTLNFKEAGIL